MEASFTNPYISIVKEYSIVSKQSENLAKAGDDKQLEVLCYLNLLLELCSLNPQIGSFKIFTWTNKIQQKEIFR